MARAPKPSYQRAANSLSVDQERDAADFPRDAQATFGGSQQEGAAEAAAWHRFVDGETPEAKQRTS